MSQEVKGYEEINGVIGSVNVSCDFFVAGLQSVAAATETSSAEGSTCGTCAGTRRACTCSTCASPRKKIDGRYRGISSPRGYTPRLGRRDGLGNHG
jgi:hypothetical protein